MNSVGQGQRILEWAAIAGDTGWQQRVETFAERARDALANPDAATDLPTTVDGWVHRLLDVREALSRPNASVNEDHYLAIVGASEAERYLTGAFTRSIDAMVDGSFTSAHDIALQAAISKFAPLASAIKGACTAMTKVHDRQNVRTR